MYLFILAIAANRPCRHVHKLTEALSMRVFIVVLGQVSMYMLYNFISVNGATTFSIKTLSITTLSIMTLSITLFSIISLRIKGLFATVSINDNQQK